VSVFRAVLQNVDVEGLTICVRVTQSFVKEWKVKSIRSCTVLCVGRYNLGTFSMVELVGYLQSW
jgi:hypothetical protein